MNTATPLRRSVAGEHSGTSLVDGVWTLGESAVHYVESAELTVLEVLRAAKDISSDSDELEAAGSASAVTYHLSNRRPNVVRFLDLPADACVLEVGSGCGAVTRYLGETCAVVDAVEPMARRAAVARERCRDLDSVEVFAGEVADVPAEPAYDVVLVNGVLEYVGNGGADHAPYREFLDAIAARLRPGGVLVLAIENQLGVKYVVGAPEDHTDREFDSLEGYPRKNHARVFSRRELTSLLRESGFEVAEALAAFPDYKRTTVLMSESLDSVDPSLAYRIPTFPSPDRRGFRHRVASEFAVWRTLVDAGLTWEFPNSFVMLAHTEGPRCSVWPEGRHAVFARNARRSEFAVRTVLEDSDDGPRFRRERHPRAGVEIDGVRQRAVSSHYQPGTEVLFELADGTDEQRAQLLQAWAQLVEVAFWDDGAPLDLLPHNLVRAPSGELVLIDDEYRATEWTRADVLRRGVLTLALKLAAMTSAQQWTATTTRELAQHLGAMVGLGEGGADGDWLDSAVEKEAALRRLVRPIDAGDEAAGLRRALNRRLSAGPMDKQAIRRLLSLEKEASSGKAAANARGAKTGQGAGQAAKLQERLRESEAVRKRQSVEIDRIKSSRAFRAITVYRRGMNKARTFTQRAGRGQR